MTTTTRDDAAANGQRERLEVPDGSKDAPRAHEDEVGKALTHSVVEGQKRLQRRWRGLLATGAVGGLDVAVGVFAVLLLLDGTGNEVLAALGFSIGFIAITLGGSELFTENFLLPVSTVAAGEGTWRQLVRLWAGTGIANVVGGLVMVFLIMTAFPDLGEAAMEAGGHYVEKGLGLEAFLGAVLAGVMITLMTWMQAASDSPAARIVAAVVAAFMLAYAHLGHVVVATLKVVAGMIGGLDQSIVGLFPFFGLLALGNLVGGVGLVTVLRLVQAGPDNMEQAKSEARRARTRPRPGPAPDELVVVRR